MCFCRAFWSLVLLIFIGMPYLSIDFQLSSSSPCHTIPHSLRASCICLKLNVESFRTSELLHKATIPNHRGISEGTISSISSAFELSWSFISPKCGLFASENQIFSLPFDVVSWVRILCIALTSSVWLTTIISQTLTLSELLKGEMFSFPSILSIFQMIRGLLSIACCISLRAKPPGSWASQISRATCCCWIWKLVKLTSHSLPHSPTAFMNSSFVPKIYSEEFAHSNSSYWVCWRLRYLELSFCVGLGLWHHAITNQIRV